MNPPQPGHLLMAINAVTNLKRQGYTNIEVMISSSQDLYLRKKFRNPEHHLNGLKHAIFHKDRMHILEFLIQKMERPRIKITASDFEQRLGGSKQFMDHPVICQRLQDQHQDKLVIYIAGNEKMR